jgi:hypothetical protein
LWRCEVIRRRDSLRSWSQVDLEIPTVRPERKGAKCLGSRKLSVVGLDAHPRAITGDRRRCSGVKDQSRRQELRVGGQVGGNLLLEDGAGRLVDDAHPDRASVRWDRDEQGEHATRGVGEGRIHVGQGWYAHAVAYYKL